MQVLEILLLGAQGLPDSLECKVLCMYVYIYVCVL